jgi:ABC-type dipeptide/oligopeptide/nickel transport system permease component
VSVKLVLLKVLGALATLAFVVVFNFFLFRVVDSDPVANLFRGRNLTQEQRQELRQQFGLDGSKLHQFGA